MRVGHKYKPPSSDRNTMMAYLSKPWPRSWSPKSQRCGSYIAFSATSSPQSSTTSGSNAEQDIQKIKIRAPDDWHLHVRDGEVLKDVVPHTAEVFSRAIIMPNLVPPVTTSSLALGYKERIMSHVPQGSGKTFEPLMTMYLTDNTPVEEVYKAKENGIVGFKMYPAGATTNSDSGVTDVRNCLEVLKAMQEVGLILLVHGEVVDPKIDIFDREKVFIENVLSLVLDKFPSLRVIMEHITTKNAVDFVKDAPNNIGATITPQHLLFNRNALFVGGIKPHHFCLPVLKREEHRLAVVEAATSGNSHFFLGTDSAPHAIHMKESACGCAGIYSAPVALPVYAKIFDEANALEHFESFTSINGAEFYGFPLNEHQIELVKDPWIVPESYRFGSNEVVPLYSGMELKWKVNY